MILVEDSDAYQYFETFQQYGETGPPAYAVFRDVDYDDQSNLDTMNQIAAEMTSTLNMTVIAPVDAWVGPFLNYIRPNQPWDEACGSTEASVLGFD